MNKGIKVSGMLMHEYGQFTKDLRASFREQTGRSAREAVAGKTFRQVYANATAQDKARMERKYSKVIPPMAKQETKATIVKAEKKAAKKSA